MIKNKTPDRRPVLAKKHKKKKWQIIAGLKRYMPVSKKL